ncbi:MAG TPA: protease pro-enzyme activation domain-containing protein, partial [Chloroflexia bacterium]|nr:protease pro-enzyme activation domain-containing protein [Chloroflexia bacterium]
MLRKVGAWSGILLLLLFGLATSAGVQAARDPDRAPTTGPRPLPEAVPALVRDGVAVATGPHVGTAPLLVLFMLPPRDVPAQDAYLSAVADPGSPYYGHYLTLDEMNARFNPTAATEGRVLAWLRANGITDLQAPANHLYVEAKGSTAAFSALLHVHIQDYEVPGRQFYAPDRPPLLPAEVAADVESISGLSNEARIHSFTNGNANGHPPYYPQDLANAYNVNPVWSAGYTGTGQKVGVVLWGAPPSDTTLTTWGGATGAAVATRANGRLVIVPINGGSTFGDTGEAAMDIEWAGSMAYTAQIRYY